MEVRTFKKGDVIIKEGLYGTCAYVIESGSVEVSITVSNKKSVLATLGQKQIFGEMGLIEDKPRSATIMAIEDTELSIISRESFNSLFEKNPKVLLPIVKSLFERLRTATQMVAATAAKSASAAPETGKEGEKGKQELLVEDNRFLVLSGTNDISKQALEGKELEIKKFPFKVGRYTFGQRSLKEDVLADNDFSIIEDSAPYYVSKNHFLIDRMDNNIVVVDRGSRTGIIVNNEVVKESCVLKEEENEIVVGSVFSPFVFKLTVKGKIKYKREGKDTSQKQKEAEKKYEEVKG